MSTDRRRLPTRFERPGIATFAVWLLVALFLAAAVQGTEVSLVEFVEGLPNLADFVARMFPPDGERLSAILAALFETFQMAAVGTVLGILLAVPIAVAASRNLSPHPVVYYAARGLISFFRTIPDLIWGLIFVIMVGLGPFAGTLAIAVDTMGFCGRFFAEAMEDVDDGPQEALTTLGATRTGVIASAVLPAAMPAFITTALFNLELATRSSVVLGIVGAGGIGMELKVAMDLFRYDEALTILLAIFVLVLAVERVGAQVRGRIIGRDAGVAVRAEGVG
ncbi:MAG: phosphonate ABC transporter, permease protein PhnE [Alphaproteobacteria bacterium]